MKFESLMHIAFFVEDFEVSRDFYENKLGLKPKMIVKYGSYTDSEKPFLKKLAHEKPDDIFLMYLEVAPGQFIELFTKLEGMKPQETNELERVGYLHFALVVEDIFKAREEFIEAGIPIDTDISIGSSHTYKMWSHDPDGNKFEVMQYTDKSMQIVGNV